MKKRIQLLLGATLIVFMGLGQAFGQTIIASDSAGNYSSWSNGDDQGYGFTSWTLETITNGGSAGHFIGSSSASGFGDVNTSNKAFGMYGNPNPGSGQNQANAFRYVNETGSELSSNGRGYLLEGQKLEFDLAIAFRNGYKGVDLVDTANGFLWNFNVQSDDYTVTTDGSLGWGYSQTSIFEISVEQVSSTQFQVTVVRGDSTYTSSNITGKVSGFKLYVGNTDVGNALNNLYLNNFSVTTTNFYRVITGSAGWRLLSLPITGGTVEDISDDTPVQGVTGGDNSGSDANFIIYDETGAFEQPTNVSTAWDDGLGFGLYFFDNTTAGSSELPVTLDASGSEPSSDVVVDLYSGATGRYTLVGNPFASNVDLADVSANIGISSNMTFWDNEAGSYTSENISGGLVIQPWQGYWVQTSNSTAGGQLTFGTADKTTSEADTTHFDKAVPNSMKELSFTIQSNYNTEKNLKIQVADDASMEWDNYDLIKLGSLIPQNASAAFVGKLDGKTVLKGIEGIPTSLDEEITLPILVDLTGESQTLTLDWEGLDKMPDSWSFMLHDYETGISYDLESIEKYEFDVIINDSQEKVNPLSVINNSIGTPMRAKSGSTPRFGITIAPGTSVGIDDEVDAPTEFALGQNYPNPFNPTTNINYSVGEAGPVNITVYNVMGQKVAELLNTTKNAGSYQLTWNATGVASGMYYYRLTAPGQVLTRQMTLIK